MALDGRDLECSHRKVMMILGNILDNIDVDLLTYFYLMRLYMFALFAIKANMTNRKRFQIFRTCEVIGDP